MANRHNQHIYSPAFNDYAYRTLKSISAEQKEALPAEELRIFKDDASLRKFCREERMDLVLAMLAKLSVCWTLTMYTDEYDKDMVEFLVQGQQEFPQKRVELTERMVDTGMCVISSREAMVLSHMLSQNCTTLIYQVSEMSKRVSEGAEVIKKVKWFEDEVLKTEKSYNLMNTIFMEQLNMLEYARSQMGLDENDMRILSALYGKKDGVMTMTQISEATRSFGRKMYFRKNMTKLMEMGLVSSDSKKLKMVWANSVFFIITTKGIGKLLEYQKKVYKNVFGA